MSSTTAEKLFTIAAVCGQNRLPSELKLSLSIASFKTQLKAYLFLVPYLGALK